MSDRKGRSAKDHLQRSLCDCRLEDVNTFHPSLATERHRELLAAGERERIAAVARRHRKAERLHRRASALLRRASGLVEGTAR